MDIKDIQAFAKPLPVIVHKEIADKYLSDKVKDFVACMDNEEVIKGSDGKDVLLKTSYLGKVIYADVVTEEHIKDFCENVINKMAAQGLIEYGSLCPVCSLELANVDGPRHLLLYYPMSRYHTETLINLPQSSFTREGELPIH